MKAVPQVCDVIGGDCVGEHLSRGLGGGGLVGHLGQQWASGVVKI